MKVKDVINSKIINMNLNWKSFEPISRAESVSAPEYIDDTFHQIHTDSSILTAFCSALALMAATALGSGSIDALGNSSSTNHSSATIPLNP